MKKLIKYTVYMLLLAMAATSCEKQNMPEPINIQHPDEQSPIVRDDAFYARLRAYKKTKHKVAFGWYGTWTAMGPSYQTRLTNTPDSMDIISIWSQWYSLTPEQMADKAYIQTVKGTKVTYTIFAHAVPETFLVDGQVTPEGLAIYAKAYAKDSMDKYQYDGIDLDYEPEWGGVGPLVDGVRVRNKPIETRVYNENMKIFLQELSKWVGPASGTGRLLLIDGVPYAVHPELAPLFDYGIVQAYASRSYTDLQTRFTDAYVGNWKPEQYIFSENFESYWKTGGVSHTLRGGGSVPSLLGMALFNPVQGEGAGFGAYHMEYEYAHSDMPYKYMRQSIQLVNPAPVGDFSKNLISINEADKVSQYAVSQLPSGVVFGEVSTTLTAKLSQPGTTDATIKLKVDNSLIGVYNNKNYTEYLAVDPTQVSISGDLVIPTGEQFSSEAVTVQVNNLEQLENGEYLVPVCPDVSNTPDFSLNTQRSVKYLIIKKTQTQIELKITGANSIPTYTVMSLIDGGFAGTVSRPLSVSLSMPAVADITVDFVADNDLVTTYNQRNGTTYAQLNLNDISITGSLSVAKGATTSTGTKTVSFTNTSSLQDGFSMIAIRPNLTKLGDYVASKTLGVQYILIYKGQQNLLSAQNLDPIDGFSTKIDNTGNPKNWVMDVVNLGSAGGTGVWSFNNAQMFDGLTTAGWYAQWNNTYSWPRGIGGRVTLDMKALQNIKALRWYARNGNNYIGTISEVSISNDNVSWIPQNSGNVIIKNGSWQWITFVTPVQAQYIRLVITDGSASTCGMSEVEVWAPKN